MTQSQTYDRVVGVGVDLIKDFFPPDGSLPVSRGEKVIAPFNAAAHWIRREGGAVVFVNDAHPAETNHFSDTPDYKKTWPSHAVDGTPGAEFHSDLIVQHNDIIMRKGMKRDEDAYSGFQAAASNGRTLRDVLRPQWRGERVAMIVGGLATDYCVKATAIDGVKFANTIEPEEGRLEVYALVDAMRPVSYASGTVALSLMNNGGVSLITSDELVAGNAIGLNR